MLILAIASCALAALLFLPFYLQQWSRSARLTKNLPGPKALPIIGSALEFGIGPEEVLENVVRLWRRYGDVFKAWIGPQLFVYVADPRHLETFLTCNANISKGLQYKFLEQWLGTGLLTSTGNKWKEHRKIITPAFHLKILEEFVEIFHSNTDILLEKWKVHLNGPMFDISEYIHLHTLDVICETAFGVRVNAQENRHSEYVKAVDGMADIFMKRAFKPWLFLGAIFKWSSLGRKQQEYLNILHKTTREVIRKRKAEHSLNIPEFVLREKDRSGERKNSHFILLNAEGMAYFCFVVDKKKRLAFLDLLLSYTRDGENLSDEEIREEVDTFMFAGNGTVSSAIKFCFWLLGSHMDIQEKVHNELQEIFGNSERKSTLRDLQEMKYLECVIKETLRLFPSAPGISRVLDQDVKSGDLHIPAGTNVVLLTYCAHRNPEIYPEPEIFDPDRFLAENSSGRNPFSFFPFSAGPRNCIGQKFAMLEIKVTLSEVLRHYKVITSQSRELALTWEFSLRASNGVFLRIEPRT